MSSDILTILQSQAHTFSKGQRLIAKYITDSYDKAAFMTASKLGKKVGVSESTVVRFAVELGYDGYPSMQKAMQEMVLNRLTSVQRIEVANDRMEGQDVISTVLRADAEKQAAILKAEAEKEAAILKADGEAQAIRTVQQALADSMGMLNEKAPNEQVIKLKAVQAMEKVADGKATKIIIPSEMQGLVGLANGLVEGTKEN